MLYFLLYEGSHLWIVASGGPRERDGGLNLLICCQPRAGRGGLGCGGGDGGNKNGGPL